MFDLEIELFNNVNFHKWNLMDIKVRNCTYTSALLESVK